MPTEARASAHLALAAAGIALALLAGEAALRRLDGASQAHTLRALHELRPDRPWLYGLRPHLDAQLTATGDIRYRTNAQGFRDPPRAPQPAPGTLRAIVLGDSVAFGYGVAQADTFPARLERLLSRTAAPVEVLNLAVNGYNPYTEARLFEDVGRGYAPGLVLVQFCVNDLHDPTLHFDAQTRMRLGPLPDAAYPDLAARRPAPGWATRLCGVSRLCERLRAWLMPGGAQAARREELAALAPPAGLGAVEREWLRARYGEIAGAATGAGAHFAIVVFPHRDQLAPGASDALQRDLARLGSESGWPVLDLLPAFRSAPTPSALFLDAWHPSGEGHRIAAEALAAWLAERGLAPPAEPAQRGGGADSPASRRATSSGG